MRFPYYITPDGIPLDLCNVTAARVIQTGIAPNISYRFILLEGDYLVYESLATYSTTTDALNAALAVFTTPISLP